MPKALLNLKCILCVVLMLLNAGLSPCSQASALPTPLSVPKVFSVSEAFMLSVTYEPHIIKIEWEISPCCYLYQEHLKAWIVLKNNERTLSLTPAQLPKPEIIDDPYFGKQAIYRQRLSTKLSLEKELSQIDQGQLQLEVAYQGCSENGFCYPPETKWFDVKVANKAIQSITMLTSPPSGTQNKAATPVEPDQDDFLSFNSISKQSNTTILLAFYVLGILLAFTPCVLPMIPILFGVIVGQKHLNTRKAFWLSLCYVISMALTYALAGILAVSLGKNLQAYFQKPAVIVCFAALFIYLGAVQLGLVRITFPHHHRFKDLLHKLHAKQESGTYIGAAIMGILATLISSPCVSAPMIGALSYISQSGNMLFGGSALLLLGLGMGTVLLAIGTIGGKFVPQSGPWMHTINHIFALFMFGLSVWMLGRVLPGPVILTLWGLLCLFAAWCMKTFRVRTGFTGHLGMLFVVYAGVLFWGAALGESAPLKPLFSNPWSQSTLKPMAFERVTDLNQLNLVMSEAQKAGKPTLVVFYAKWCNSCQHLEHHVFTNPQVQKALSSWKVVQADITEYTQANQLLMSSFDIIGPPALLFFDANGSELKNYRVIGETSVKALLSQIELIAHQKSSKL